MTYQTDCRYFNGYKPCGLNAQCDAQCIYKKPLGPRVLLIHLGALGAVVRSTALLALIKKKYPDCVLTWVTDAPAQHLLQNHPLIDRVFTTETADLLQLKALRFDVAFCLDKSLKAAGVLASTDYKQIFGFSCDAFSGAIKPASAAAEELWELGLNDEKKFHHNQKTELQLMIEALELDVVLHRTSSGEAIWPMYNLPLSETEKKLTFERRAQWQAPRQRQKILGINTGCSPVIPYKKWTVAYHRQWIESLMQDPTMADVQIVLLGGPEDSERNKQIAKDLPVISSPTTLGLRDGLCSVAACDVVVTGDSLGMHMAIALQKPVVAWFGPTCAQEIELYGRGQKILSKASCGPCWKRFCDKTNMCYDLVSMQEVTAAVKNVLGLPGRPKDQEPDL
ncbi:MAG: glycosyltransferase family 9 protein [Pseudobdellovibrionaceae bacterium]